MNTQHDSQDETLDAIRDAWQRGQPFRGEVCGPEPHHYIQPEQLTEARTRWHQRVQALLSASLDDLVPRGDVVLAVLGSDRLGPFMADIEEARGVTLAIEGGFHLDEFGHPGQAHEVTLLRLTPSSEDPFDWIEDDNFMGCEFDFDWLMLQVALSALSMCRQAYWATETDQPAAWAIDLLWPQPNASGAAETQDVSAAR